MTEPAAAPRESALIAVISEAEPVVGHWRERYDPSAAWGVPAHVTLLYPFLDPALIDDETRASLAAVFARHAAFPVTFRRCGRFPDTVYLAPEPAAPFRALTGSLTERWPQCQPYGGQFADVIPHMTVADRQPPPLLDDIEAAVTAQLPMASLITSAALYVGGSGRWASLAEFPLA